MKATTVIQVWRDSLSVQVGGQLKYSANKRAEFPDTQKDNTYNVFVDGRKRGTVRGGTTITITKE